jgi:hypothetical protein
MPHIRSVRLATLATLTAASTVAVALTAPAAHAITGGTTAGGWNQPLQEVARITIGALQRGCTGTLIAPTWVVTAASCFATDPAQGFLIQPGPPPMPTVVQVGDEASPDKQTMGGGTSGGTANAVQLIPRTDRDVVLVALDRNLHYDGLRVATRPPAAGEQLDIAGFGRTEKDWVPMTLQVAHTTVSSVSPSSVEIAGASSTCRGDGGGPTLRGGVSDKSEVAAIHGPSWQHGCFAETEKNNGATEIRLDDIYPWILQNVPDVRAGCSSGTGLLVTRGGAAWNTTHLDDTNNLRPLAPLTGTGHWDGLTPVTAPDIPALSGTIRQSWGIWEVHRKTGSQDPVADGDLRQTAYRYTDPTATRMTTITAARGWQRFLDPSHSNQITVDTRASLEEHIYTIGANGELRMFRWDAFYDKWVNPDGEVIDTGWDKERTSSTRRERQKMELPQCVGTSTTLNSTRGHPATPTDWARSSGRGTAGARPTNSPPTWAPVGSNPDVEATLMKSEPPSSAILRTFVGLGS